MDEREFLSGVNRKDERAWKELYDCFYAPLCCYSARISKDGTEAEDVVQDCLVKLWHSEVKFEDMKVITSYLYRAVYRATLNAVRDRERDRRIHERWVEGLAEDEGRAAEMALEEEAITRFHKVLELLPGQQRDILLHCMKGEKVREIAEALGVSENTVKTQKKRADAKRTYRKKTNAVRLCADDLLNRERLVAYHDSYAAAMAKYGLQRGIRGSEARHTTTAQYYRDLKRQTGELEANVQQLQTEQQQAERQLYEVRKEIKSEKLEAAKTEAKAALVAKVGSLLGSGKLKELEADNRTLQGEVVARDESIELLQQQTQRQQEEHDRQLMELQAKHRREMADKETAHQKEVSFLKSIIQKAKKWFPLFQELVYMEKFCLKVGFNERQTATLISGKPLFYEGELYSEEHRWKFTTERAGFQVVKDPKDKSKLALAINGQVIGEWFKEQFDRLCRRITKHPKIHR